MSFFNHSAHDGDNVWAEWELTRSDELLLCHAGADSTDCIMEVHYTEDGLSYTSDDLVRRGPSGRLCVEDDERLYDDMPPLSNIMIIEDDDIQVIEPEIVYLKTVINIDLSNE